MKTPRTPFTFWAFIVFASLITGVSVWLIKTDSAMPHEKLAVEPEKPLYWVAPMDSNYRRNQPGKSPMGMDLIPVYANNNQSTEPVGTVFINPQVVNNLGVRTTQVKRGSLNQYVNTVGYINYNQDTLIHIHPRVEGWVDQLFVKTEGDAITKGQALYSLYSPELVNAQEEYLLALARKDSRLLAATTERLAALHVPKQTIDYLKKTKKTQQKITFYASQNGIIENLAIREGFYVKPGTTMFSIADLSEVWLEAEVFERQANLVKSGAEVKMQLNFLPAKQWTGNVDYIYPSVNQKTRTILVRIRFSNADLLLKPNMFAQVKIQAIQTSNALLIPHSSVIRTSKGNRVVIALGDGKFKSVAVEIGQSDHEYFEVLSGLKEADSVVVSAQFLLDSESSKTSDFMRMSGVDDRHESQSEMPAKAFATARVKGVVNTIDMNNLRMNISREAIEKWQRPATTMDFVISESIDVSQISLGASIDFTFEIQGDDFVITMLHTEVSEQMIHGHH